MWRKIQSVFSEGQCVRLASRRGYGRFRKMNTVETGGEMGEGERGQFGYSRLDENGMNRL